MQVFPCQNFMHRKRVLLIVTLINVAVFLGYAVFFIPHKASRDDRNLSRRRGYLKTQEFILPVNLHTNTRFRNSTYNSWNFTKWNETTLRSTSGGATVPEIPVDYVDALKPKWKARKEADGFDSTKETHLLDGFPSRVKSYEEKHKINVDMNLYLRSSGWFSRLMRNHITIPSYPYILNSRSYCSAVSSNGSDMMLLVAVLTSVRNVANRAAIRDTWGREVEDRGAKVIFFLGTDKHQSLAVQNLVEEESRDFGDLVQMNFTDSYYNLSTKTVSMMRWILEFCAETKYVFKTDDDVYVNVDVLFPFLDGISNVTSSSVGLWGLLVHNSRPARDKHSKWFVPQRTYPWTFYPDFIAGPAYIISGLAVPLLFQTAVKMSPFFLEDIFITGFVSEVAGVPKYNESRMHNLRDRLDPCKYNQTMTSHYHPSWDLRRRWKLVHDGFFKCRSEAYNRTEEIHDKPNETATTWSD